MKKYTNEEIYNALKVIHETCNEYKDAFNGGQCMNCPMRDDYDNCGVLELEPCDWEIRELDDWKAFK